MPATKTLTGVLPPIPTPLTDDEQLDEASFRRLIEYLIDGGVDGLFVLGSNGEFPLLPNDVKERVCHVAADAARGRIKVVINVSETSVARVMPVLRMAERAGADGVGLIAPYYYPMADAEIAHHFRCVSEETNLPLLVYNFPKMSKLTMAAELVEELIETANVNAIKDSSGDMPNFRKFIALSEKCPQFSAILAPTNLIAMAVTYGADGVITGLANVAPRLVADLFEAAKSGDLARAGELQRKADRLMGIFSVGGSPISGPQGGKSALMLLGVIASNRLMRPFVGHTAEQAAQVRAILKAEGML